MPTALQAVADAMRYLGHPYVWGGWDCSGMINHIIGQDLKLAIPGYPAGTYKGPPPHGPVVSDWIATDLCVTVAGPPKPGDLVCYGPDVHIGMAVSGTRFISAADPTLGTIVAPISSGPTPNPIYRRVKAFGLSGSVPIVTRPHRSDAASVLVRVLLVGGLVVGAGVAVVAGVAFLTSGAGAAAATVAASRRTRADY